MNKYLPEAPKNVRGVINGVEYPMKLSYGGPTPSGHLWICQWPEGVDPPDPEDFNGMRADVLPARTGLACPLAES